MRQNHNHKWIIVGGGLAGSLLAIYLGKRGHNVETYEMRDDLRTADTIGGRSINLALSHRGICALKGAGIADDILRLSVPMRGRMIHSLTGRLFFQPYGKDKHHVINSVSRSGLNIELLNAAADLPNVELFFNYRCTHVNFEDGEIGFTDTRSGIAKTVQGDIIVAADGAFSEVRKHMQRRDRFNYEQSYLEHGYKELTIPPAPDGGFQMEKNALHIWPRRSYMMIALPNSSGSFTCTLFWPLNGPFSFDTLKTPNDVQRFFERTFSDAVPLMPTLIRDYFDNPTRSLVTIRCGPWFVGDRAVAIGDACHAVVPFYGQGMNAAFEDVIVLTECIDRFPNDLEQAFHNYYESRKKDVDTLADLAIANFSEMRDHTGKHSFLLKKKAEKWLSRLFPKWFIPLYTMVTFTRIPYADAVERAQRQNWFIEVAGALLILLLVFMIMISA